METDKIILDACCGPRLFWFDKTHPRTLYIDNRSEEKGYDEARPTREIKPDILMDFRSLDLPDKKFKLIVWDPPHLKNLGATSRLAKHYGSLNAETWHSDLSKGFEEIWRVLDDYGILIFKWNEQQIKLKQVLNCFSEKPLFGHPTNSKNTTYWCCFMKIPNQKEVEV